MLGKLLKYDWKYSWRLLGLLNGALLVFSLLGQLGSPVLWHGSRMLSGILTVLYAFIYVLLFSGSLIATQIILVVRLRFPCDFFHGNHCFINIPVEGIFLIHHRHRHPGQLLC